MPVANCDHKVARRMAAIAAISQNLATGLLFGSFGTMLFALEERFHADRSQSSATISFAVVSLSLTAAWLGSRIGKQSLRGLMLLGAVLSSVGFVSLTLATTVHQLWAIYFLLLGPGAGLSGVLASNTLASIWSPQANLGRTLGWVNAPVAVTLLPLLCEFLLARIGLNGLLLFLGVCHLVSLPLLMLVQERVSTQEVLSPKANPAMKPGKALIFALVLIIGIISGGGLLKLSHMLPLVVGQGYSFSQANILLSISGLTGIFGSLALGWLADRIGPSVTLAANALLQAVSWLILLVPSAYALLVVDAVIVGICGGGLQATIGALLTRIFGPKDFGRVYGLVSLLTLPFLFGLPWLAGVLFVRTGGYFMPISLQIAAFIGAGIGALLLAKREKGTDL